MARGILHPLRTTWLAAVFLVFSWVLSSPSFATDPAPCFDVRVEFRGREATSIVDNVQFYRWTYRVYGAACINRALSNWSMELCASMQLSGISQGSVDASDAPNGTVASYKSDFSKAPLSNVHILKWDFLGGNAIDRVNEYDEFSFIASGDITTVNWSAKGSTITKSGTTLGPTCAPVATQPTTWGGIKSRAR